MKQNKAAFLIFIYVLTGLSISNRTKLKMTDERITAETVNLKQLRSLAGKVRQVRASCHVAQQRL